MPNPDHKSCATVFESGLVLHKSHDNSSSLTRRIHGYPKTLFVTKTTSYGTSESGSEGETLSARFLIVIYFFDENPDFLKSFQNRRYLELALHIETLDRVNRRTSVLFSCAFSCNKIVSSCTRMHSIAKPIPWIWETRIFANLVNSI